MKQSIDEQMRKTITRTTQIFDDFEEVEITFTTSSVWEKGERITQTRTIEIDKIRNANRDYILYDINKLSGDNIDRIETLCYESLD